MTDDRRLLGVLTKLDLRAAFCFTEGRMVRNYAKILPPAGFERDDTGTDHGRERDAVDECDAEDFRSKNSSAGCDASRKSSMAGGISSRTGIA